MRVSSKIIAVLMLWTSLFLLLACDSGNIPVQAAGGLTGNTYTVAFNSQFNNTESETQMPVPTSKTVTSPATTIDSLPTPPTLSGYRFGGWWTRKGGYGIPFTENTVVIRDMTVFAYWYKYKVIYISDAVNQTRHSMSMTSTNTVSSLPSIPQKDGSDFGGWWTGDACNGEEFTTSTIINDSNTVDGEMTVYACWRAADNVRTVTYQSEQSVVAIQHVEGPAFTLAASGSDLPVPEKPCREFQGWWTEQNGGGTEFLTSTVVPDGNITVYAKWNTNEVRTITYNSGRGSTVETQCVTGSDLVNFTDFTLNANSKDLPADPSKRCYAFDGWWTDKYGQGDSFNENTPVPENITVYADWNWVGIAPPPTYAVGDYGPSCIGKVFYIAEDGHQGMEAAPPGWYDWYSENPDPGFPWIAGDALDNEFGEYQPVQQTRNDNTATDIGTGLTNSLAIMAQDGAGGTEDKDYAAKICINYSGGGFDDWFLPSKDELAQLFINRDVKRSGGFADVQYWSSSEFELGSFDAWSQDFENGKQNGSYKSDSYINVRPVREFAF